MGLFVACTLTIYVQLVFKARARDDVRLSALQRASYMPDKGTVALATVYTHDRRFAR